MKCCEGTLYYLSSIGKLGHDEQCCGSILHNSSVGFIDNNNNQHYFLCVYFLHVFDRAWLTIVPVAQCICEYTVCTYILIVCWMHFYRSFIVMGKDRRPRIDS